MSPHHLGFAVTDLDTAMAEVGALFGVEWAAPTTGRSDYFRSRGGRVEWQLSHVKSTGASGLTIELLEDGLGSTWHVDRGGPSGIVFHHYAYAPVDRVRRLDSYLAAGWTVDVCRDVDDPRDSTFSYLTKVGHPRIELCLP